MPTLTRDEFSALVDSARGGGSGDGRDMIAPIGIRLLADQLTPVLVYRRLVAPDERTAPSFLLESVEGGERQGRYSMLGAQPAMEVISYGNRTRIVDHRAHVEEEREERDPLAFMKGLTAQWRYLAPARGTVGGPAAGLLPRCVLGGWFGCAAYDAVRWAEPEKLDSARAPRDDRGLPDLHFGFYDRVVVFDHVDKIAHLVRLVRVRADEDAGEKYDDGRADLEEFAAQVQTHSKPLPSGRVDRRGPGAESPLARLRSNLTRAQHAEMVAKAKEYIRAGDIFQVVVGQRFERMSSADPFDVYRALRAVNPSPYMVYLQAEGCILVASSPEILCRVRRARGDGGSGGAEAGSESRPTRNEAGSESRPSTSGSSTRFIVTNRPLAGTRRRGATEEEDRALEEELLKDEKERAEHIMLVDLGRNDVGRVCEAGTIRLAAVMEVERYSHVMHISSTVTGELREGLDSWDALRAALPVGTISGAPKIRAMQIIDELEPVRRGPYGGGMGYVSLDGDMDIALALRTMVVPTRLRGADGVWTYHLQAAGGIVADSRAEDEFAETENKAAGLAAAIDLAEAAFVE